MIENQREFSQEPTLRSILMILRSTNGNYGIFSIFSADSKYPHKSGDSGDKVIFLFIPFALDKSQL
jgi:hypothetical protein